MANGDDELDQQHGQGADELEGPEVDEHDNGQGDLAEHDQYLGGLIKQGEQAGYGAQTVTLKRVRKALRNTRQQIAAAEERGRQRALAEFAAGDGQQAVDAIRGQLQAEMAEQTSRERSLARLGIGPDSPVRSLFDGVQGDHKAFERQASLLRAAGVSWDADPLVRRIGQQQVAQWQQQAEQNGQAVPLDPAAGVPEVVRENVIRQQVEAMQAGQAGGKPVGADHLEDEIRRAHANPGNFSPEQLQGLADRFNRDLDALSRGMQGG
jgi:hypothetical protein